MAGLGGRHRFGRYAERRRRKEGFCRSGAYSRGRLAACFSISVFLFGGKKRVFPRTDTLPRSEQRK